MRASEALIDDTRATGRQVCIIVMVQGSYDILYDCNDRCRFEVSVAYWSERGPCTDALRNCSRLAPCDLSCMAAPAICRSMVASACVEANIPQTSRVGFLAGSTDRQKYAQLLRMTAHDSFRPCRSDRPRTQIVSDSPVVGNCPLIAYLRCSQSVCGSHHMVRC